MCAAGPVAEGSHSNRDGHLVPSAATPAGAHARFLGPSQRRYGDYFLSVLASPELRRQEGLTKVLRQVGLPASSLHGGDAVGVPGRQGGLFRKLTRSSLWIHVWFSFADLERHCCRYNQMKVRLFT